MNTFHRFFAAGVLTGLSLVYSSAVLADELYQQQYQPQYQQPNQQYQQQPRQRSYGEKIGNKALNGVVNLSTAPLEIPKGLINNINAKESNLVFGLVGGALEGSLNTLARATIGATDLALFLLPTKVIIQPQYVWEDFYETNTMYGDIFRLDSNESDPVFRLPEQK
ncbi:MAG: exosortase system-associated protein, TIGR04073 family [Methylococcales bacterium]|nr:exosortase system-associated protein, TIGR04073 family [Methylococcales bacterium]